MHVLILIKKCIMTYYVMFPNTSEMGFMYWLLIVTITPDFFPLLYWPFSQPALWFDIISDFLRSHWWISVTAFPTFPFLTARCLWYRFNGCILFHFHWLLSVTQTLATDQFNQIPFTSQHFVQVASDIACSLCPSRRIPGFSFSNDCHLITFNIIFTFQYFQNLLQILINMPWKFTVRKLLPT